MKIAVVSSGHIPTKWAHSINTVKHAQGFVNLDNSVEILTVESILETFLSLNIKDIHAFYDISKRIKIHHFKDNPLFYFKDIPLIKQILDNLKNKRPHLRYLMDPEKRISNYCKKNQFDLSYCRSYRSAYYNIKRKIPTIIETHTPNLNNFELRLLFKLSKDIYFKGLITISDILKEKYVNAGVPEKKILVLEDAVDLNKFDIVNRSKNELRHELGLPLDRKIVMYCGSLKPGKGIGKILETAKNFNRDIIFCIIGGTQRNLYYWRNIAKKNKLKNVIFKGFIRNNLIPQYLKSADILYMPYDLAEKCMIMDINTSSPIKLFEYMASKRPIVSLKIPTIEKILHHNKEAYLAKSDDVNEYVKLIQNLLKDEKIANVLAQNAYNCVKKYTYENRCRIILENFG